MAVINTNTVAEQTSNNLRSSTAALSKSLSRLSSGLKIVTPSDDAAGLAVSSRLDAQIKRLDAALNNVVNAVSFTQTQDGFLKTIDKALRRMGELAMLSQDVSKSVSDRLLYNQEFVQLQDYVRATAGKTFNSVSLFSGAAFNVTIDELGGTFQIAGTPILENSTYAIAIATTVSLLSSSLAQTALNVVASAINQIALDRARLGAVQSRLNFTNDQLTTTKENLSSAISRISDVDVAQEATQYARYQILVQSGTTMLAQANALPRSVLELLRQ
ncbi:MAG: flagellin [Verrucomicrobia bacterium]|nr:flagellin [Verrucomicrobiota bacterium]